MFDTESPRFREACNRLKINKDDLIKKKMSHFIALVRNERPEEDKQSALIKELALIKYNYHLQTYKEVFHDVMRERKNILQNESNR